MAAVFPDPMAECHPLNMGKTAWTESYGVREPLLSREMGLYVNRLRSEWFTHNEATSPRRVRRMRLYLK